MNNETKELKFELLNKGSQRQFEEIKEKVFEDDSLKDFEKDIFDRINKKQVKEYGKINYALIIHKNEKVGLIGYYTAKNDSKNMWIGWYGVVKEHRHKGYGQRALLKLEEYIKNNFPEVEAIRVYTGLYENKGGSRII